MLVKYKYQTKIRWIIEISTVSKFIKLASNWSLKALRTPTVNRSRLASRAEKSMAVACMPLYQPNQCVVVDSFERANTLLWKCMQVALIMKCKAKTVFLEYDRK